MPVKLSSLHIPEKPPGMLDQYSWAYMMCSSSRRALYTGVTGGFIAVFQQGDADHYRKLEDFAVQKMVHSLAVDTATHRVFAPEQQADGKPVARMIVYEAVESAPKR